MTLKELRDKLNAIEDEATLNSDVVAIQPYWEDDNHYIRELEVEDFEHRVIQRTNIYKEVNGIILGEEV